MNYKEKYIKIPIYSGRLAIIFTDSVENLPEQIQQFFDDDIMFHSVNYYIWSHDGQEKLQTFFLVLNPFTEMLTEGKLAHESSHITKWIFEYIGSDHTAETDEHYSYILEWIVDQVIEFKSECNL